MAGQSGFVRKMEAERREWMETVERVTRQFDQDTLQIALSRYSKIKFGYQRIMEISELWEAVREEYRVALTNDPEADVAREHMTQEQLQIAKDSALVRTFEEQYPELRKITYGGRRRC